MESVFDTPLTSIEFEQSLGVSLLRREAGDAVDGFGRFSSFRQVVYITPDAKDLLDMGKIQVVVEFFTGPDGAGLNASVAFFCGVVLGRRVGEVEIFDIFLEGGLIIFDREEVVRFFSPRPGSWPFRVGYAWHP